MLLIKIVLLDLLLASSRLAIGAIGLELSGPAWLTALAIGAIVIIGRGGIFSNYL